MLLLIAAVFVLCVAYVSWCDHIIGPDPAEAHDDVGTDAVANEVPETAVG